MADGARLLGVLASSRFSDAREIPFDLVVSDIRRPRVNVLGALELLLEKPDMPPVVVATAWVATKAIAVSRKRGEPRS